ncbi:MAG: hypothetical protein JWP97_1404 [Labilithrix sp.]|nr:hypothetical protein [Labilithrix sp.]
MTPGPASRAHTPASAVTRAARLAAVLVLAMSGVALAAACGSDDPAAAPAPDGGAPDGAMLATACPSAAPAAGSECTLPEGTTCDFGACGTRLARCTRGVWFFAGNPPPRSICPEVAPNAAVACPACWQPEVTCSYGSPDCTLPDASQSTTLASCPDGEWLVEFRPCRDAGPDVQGDGGPDAG